MARSRPPSAAFHHYGVARRYGDGNRRQSRERELIVLVVTDRIGPTGTGPGTDGDARRDSLAILAGRVQSGRDWQDRHPARGDGSIRSRDRDLPRPDGRRGWYVVVHLTGIDHRKQRQLIGCVGAIQQGRGTGIRHLSTQSAITATINGQSVQVYYAGAQNTYKGLDQVNVQIPSSLSGSGVVKVVLTVDDTVNHIRTTLNTVTLDIQ